MTLIYLYNLLLIILYATTASLALSHFMLEKEKYRRRFLLLLMIFFCFFILDNWIISMTELFSSFSQVYNENFQGLPIAKTVIFTVNNYCLIAVLSLIKKEKVSALSYSLLALDTLWMLILPLFPSSHIQVYLYYLPNQLFLYYCGLYCLRGTADLAEKSKRYLKYLAIVFFLFGTTIIIEDTFVIFMMDNYNKLDMRIQNRNFNEDIFSVVLAVLAIYYLIKERVPSQVTAETLTRPSSQNLFDEFCKYYHLTQREQEIFALLLEGKHNQEIADDLFLSLGTVKTHIHNIYIKLDINKRTDIQKCYQAFTQMN